MSISLFFGLYLSICIGTNETLEYEFLLLNLNTLIPNIKLNKLKNKTIIRDNRLKNSKKYIYLANELYPLLLNF